MRTYNFKNDVKAGVAIGILAAFVTWAPAAAWARSTQDQPYATDATWSAAVRFLRVDMRFPVLERDKDAGYILFDYLQDAKVYKASLELMAVEESTGRAATRVVVSVPDLPRHVEAVLLDKLARKLKDELGAPAPPPSRGKTQPSGRRDEGKTIEDKAEPRRESGGDQRPHEKTDEDPNAPVRGDDGLPRLRTRELPRTAGQ